ncbi:MAG: lycopene cyclase domain-containing protein [Candidatus Omnitrophica bacterium]|nr:lycopene cyclase domain-containing protein [Candidatus Omnitrophota bacterium]
MYTYLLVDLLTISLPFVFSFEKRIGFAKKWKYVLPSILIVAAVFVTWDQYFTRRGVWGFNPKYVIGRYFLGLPLEEILFFFCIPFSCLFIYEVVRYLQKQDALGGILKPFTNVLIGMLLLTAVWNVDRVYTSTTFLLMAVLLAVHLYVIKPDYLGYFFQMYLISLIPFLIVNGILTNGLRFIDAGPVVWYDNTENLSFRILNIPVEDFIYSMLLLLLNTTVYEYFKKR